MIDYLADSGMVLGETATERELLDHRTIVVSGDINAHQAGKVVRALRLLDARDPQAAIDLFLRTEGGWVDDAFAIIDTMHGIRAPVNTHSVGGTHSAGSMILVAGTGHRTAHRNSSIMIHAGLSEDESSQSQGRVDNLRLRRLWRERAKLPEDWVTQVDEDFYYLDAEEALAKGLIDAIK